MRIVRVPNWMMGKWQDLTLAPIAAFIRANMIMNRRLYRHVARHWKDQTRLWYIGFYISWCYQWIKYKGDCNKISFEKLALEAENN